MLKQIILRSKKLRQKNRALLDSFHAMRCAACFATPCDPAHIKSVGSGGDDVEDNLLALCRRHHTESHMLGWHHFTEKYPNVRLALGAKGWDFDYNKKLRKI